MSDQQRYDTTTLKQQVSLTSIAALFNPVKRIGKDWVTNCPWHDDQHPSLTIFNSRQGFERCYCHSCGAGGTVIDFYMAATDCDTATAIAALAQGNFKVPEDYQRIVPERHVKPAEWIAEKPPQTILPGNFDSQTLGKCVGSWAFRDQQGEVLYYEVRYETIDEETGEVTKHPRPLTWGRMSKHVPLKWASRGWQAPRPIFGLEQFPEGHKHKQVIVFEGPRKAEMAQRLVHVPCVSWSNGAKAWHLSDWSMMRGLKVILVPDNDLRGHDAMRGLAQHLLRQGAKEVAIVNLPNGTPEKWDICDVPDMSPEQFKALIKNRTTVLPHTIKYQLNAPAVFLALQDTDAPAYTPAPAPAPAPGAQQHSQWIQPTPLPEGEWGEPEDLISEIPIKPLPDGCLPDIIENYAREVSPTIGSDSGAMGMACLATIASAIDDSIRLMPDRHGTWGESARIWVTLIGPPSAKKTPTISKATSHLKKLDHDIMRTNATNQAKYQSLKKIFDAKVVAWGENPDQPFPEAPELPNVIRYYANDVTIEAFVEIMARNPRGILLEQDELSSWIGSHGQYKTGASADRGQWLQAYNGGSYKNDRVSKGSTHVPNFSACVIAGIQPDVLRKLAATLPEDGLLQRFIPVFIAAGDPGISPTAEHASRIKMAADRYHALIDHCTGMTGQHKVYMSDRARQITRDIYARLNGYAKHEIIGGKGSSALMKYEGLLHRILLIYHVIECYQAGRHPADEEVSEKSALLLERLAMQYIVPNLIVLYTNLLGANQDYNNLMKAANWILSHGIESLTASELQRAAGEFRELDQRKRREILMALYEANWIRPDGHRKDSITGMPARWQVNPSVQRLFESEAEVARAKLEAKKQMMEEAGYINRWKRAKKEANAILVSQAATLVQNDSALLN